MNLKKYPTIHEWILAVVTGLVAQRVSKAIEQGENPLDLDFIRLIDEETDAVLGILKSAGNIS